MSEQWEQLWREIELAGGVQRYVQQQMVSKGYVVTRRPTDNMSAKALEQYKKELKAEATEQRKIKHSAWQAYRSQHMVHLGTGIYWSDDSSADRWDLANAEKRLLDNQLPQLHTVKQLAEALTLSIGHLRSLCYHRDAALSTHYQRFEIAKRRGGMREIWAPTPALKHAQRWILHHMLDQMLVHGAAHGFMAGRSIATHAAEHRNSQLLVKVDIKDFFPSVSWRRIKGVFRHAGYHEQVSTLLALLCTESPRQVVQHDGKTYYVALGERCLPQGAPTSPALTNILCLRLDRRLTGIAHTLGWRYSRYADDLTFSFPMGQDNPQIGHVLGSLQRILTEEGFKLHPDKTHIVRTGARQDITGLVVNGDHAPRVSREKKRQLRAAIHNAKHGKPLPEGESLQRMQGYAAFIAMTDPTLGKQMLAEIASLNATALASPTATSEPS
jgi:retron-type reverse transcriptase